MMAASDDDAMEEASVFTLSSPPRSASKSSTATALFQEQTTPKSSRRLFGDDADNDDDEGFFNPTRAPALTPFNANPRRARLARPIQRQDSIDSEDLTGRKRSSEERRDSYEGDTSMHMSPHISPNSYMTMDGRFVHSKNPFSSPMVTEDDNHHMPVLAGAPSLPFFSSSNSNASMGSTAASAAGTPASPHRPPTLGMVPPRHAREKRGNYRDRLSGGGSVSGANDNTGGGFIDARFSFTGSPIPEHRLPTPRQMDSGPDTASSISKVRRLNESDDVVSALGQHWNNRRRPYLTIDTAASDLSCTSFSDSSTGTWKTEDEDHDRISPTDIISFPPPPTPAKNSSNYPRYKTKQAPPTPVAQRRHEKLMQRRTPHPGSILRRHHPEHSDETPTVKSRFYDDFDIIQELGKGSFGTVYQVLSRLDGVSFIGPLASILSFRHAKTNFFSRFQCMYAIKAAQRQAKGASDRDRMLKEVRITTP